MILPKVLFLVHGNVVKEETESWPGSPVSSHTVSWMVEKLCPRAKVPRCQSESPVRLHCINFAAAAKSLQLCPTLWDPIDGSPPGSPIPGILQARTLEWVAISFSNAWKWKVKVKSLSRVRLSVTPWTAALRAPPSMGFSKQESWSGVPFSLLTILSSRYHIHFIDKYVRVQRTQSN